MVKYSVVLYLCSIRYGRYGGVSSLTDDRPTAYYSDVWPRQGRKGAGKGRRQASSESAARQHPGNHEAGDPSSGSSRRREAHLGPDLRGDARRAEGVPRERDSRRRHLHGAR